MAGTYLVSCNKPLKCPSGKKLYVKHVILRKDNEDQTQPREVKNSLMIHQLYSEGGKQGVWDKLLTVEFSSYSEDEIKGILSSGIEFDGSQYCFLGFSESQLRNKTCFLIKETKRQIGERRAKLGNFNNVIPFADRTATAQHMFEPFERSLQLAEDEFKFEQHRDPSSTVPSGFMSPELAEEIKTTCSLAKKPSVVQVICPGFSGKLVLSDEICARASEDVRPSRRIKALIQMQQIPDSANICGNPLTIGVVDCAKPYKVGYLDVYSVMFLKKRGVTREYLLELQKRYYGVLEKLGVADLTFAKNFLRLNGREELLRTIEHEITDEAQGKILKIKADEIKSMKNGTKPELRVLVEKSREVFGIEDPYKDQDKALEPDECVFNPCLDCLNDQDKELFGTAKQVLVIPQPCYTSADIRVLNLVRDKGEYENLEDCIVLPSKSEDQVSIANKYFVCWDRNLMHQKPDSYLDVIANNLSWPELRSQIFKVISALPACSREPRPTRYSFVAVGTSHKSLQAESRSKESNLHEDGSFQDELKTYFATFKNNDDLVSRAKALFEEFAALRGDPSCSECKKLGEYLSPSFDWNTKRKEVENYLAKRDKKYQKHSSDPKGTQDSATHDQSSQSDTLSPDGEETQDATADSCQESAVHSQFGTPQPVWKEMTENLREFIAQHSAE